MSSLLLAVWTTAVTANLNSVLQSEARTLREGSDCGVTIRCRNLRKICVDTFRDQRLSVWCYFEELKNTAPVSSPVSAQYHSNKAAEVKEKRATREISCININDSLHTTARLKNACWKNKRVPAQCSCACACVYAAQQTKNTYTYTHFTRLLYAISILAFFVSLNS